MTFPLVRAATALAFAFVLALAAATPAPAAENALSAAQKKEVEDIVRKLLRENPEVLLEAIAALRAKQEAAERDGVRGAIAKFRAEIETDPASPVGGNPKGDVTLVEFFDYRCGYCKRVHSVVRDLLKADGKIRFVYKEFPVLGPESVFAARVALAAFKVAPAKYQTLHDKLMALPSNAVSEESVMAAVKDAGLDAKAVRRGMDDPAIEKEIARVRDLAEELGIRGTPSFVVGDTLIPGAADAETFKKAIAEARKKS